MPVTGRDKAAKGVTAVEVASIRCVSPGVSRESSGATALEQCQVSCLSNSCTRNFELTSGVVSLGANPVPPVIRTRSSFATSLQYSTVFRIAKGSSGTIARC